jgi:hypothetical protein
LLDDNDSGYLKMSELNDLNYTTHENDKSSHSEKINNKPKHQIKDRKLSIEASQALHR